MASQIKEFALNYGAMDRMVHKLAFGSRNVLSTAIDLENSLYKRRYEGFAAARPVFVTSLPRAGTTLLLDLLHRFGTLATHTYRDMPFVMAPYLWSRMSGPFQKRAQLRERAHGDGMAVGYDSPEAFEEILWRWYWSRKYGESRIALWNEGDFDAEATQFIAEHMKKIVALRRPECVAAGRYLSKNNANIARLRLLRRMFADASILVIFRQPIEHAASLLRQHENFLEMHRETPFIKDYMADLGHYEFGLLHRLIAFPRTDELVAGRDPLTIDYWLAYWIAAFEHILAEREFVAFVSYERLCASGAESLAAVCETIGADDPAALADAAATLREPAPARARQHRADPDLLGRADALHRELVALAVNGGRR